MKLYPAERFSFRLWIIFCVFWGLFMAFLGWADTNRWRHLLHEHKADLASIEREATEAEPLVANASAQALKEYEVALLERIIRARKVENLIGSVTAAIRSTYFAAFTNAIVPMVLLLGLGSMIAWASRALRAPKSS